MRQNWDSSVALEENLQQHAGCFALQTFIKGLNF